MNITIVKERKPPYLSINQNKEYLYTLKHIKIKIRTNNIIIMNL